MYPQKATWPRATFCSSTRASAIHTVPTSIRPPTWSSRGCRGCAAEYGACARKPDLPWSGSVPHRHQAAMVGVLTEPAQGGDVELQARCGGDVQAQPGHSDGAQDVAVRKRKQSTVEGFAQRDEIAGAGVDLSGRLPARRAVPVDLPAGMLVVNLCGGDAFVLAVINLAQERRELRIREPRDLSCTHGALKWAREHGVEAKSAQPGPQRARFVLALGQERDIGAACVLA